MHVAIVHIISLSYSKTRRFDNTCIPWFLHYVYVWNVGWICVVNLFNVSLSFPCDKISLLHVMELSDFISKNHGCITSHAAFLLPPPLYIKLNSCLHFIIVDICGIWNICTYNAKLVWFIVYIYIKYIETLAQSLGIIILALFWLWKTSDFVLPSTLINPRLMICLYKCKQKCFTSCFFSWSRDKVLWCF